MIFLTDFFDSRCHNDGILLPAILRVSGNDFVPAGQCTGTPRRARGTVELLRQKRQTFLRPTCHLQTAQILVLWITRSVLSCSIVSTTDKSIVWMNWNGGSSMCMVWSWTVDFWRGQWQRRHRACVHAKRGHFEYSWWTDNVDFVHICYIQRDLFDCYIFNYKIMQQRWPFHSCSFYKVVH